MILSKIAKNPLDMIDTLGANVIATVIIVVLITVPQIIKRETTRLHHQIQQSTYPSVSMSTASPYPEQEGTL